MGIYLKGMEMPKNGDYLNIKIYSDGGVFMQNTSYGGWEAIPVPDHGDLIERDALKNECKENAKRGIGLWVDYMDISLAPTIIPSDHTDRKENR